jgi:hypothetical protein
MVPEKTQDQNGVTYWSVVPFFGILKNSAKKNPAVGPVEVKHNKPAAHVKQN